MNKFSDELISAYLDGELTAEEQHVVEEALMDSAELRQLFAELKSLRSQLQSVPQERLPADFADRVLKRAEQQMLKSAEAEEESPQPQELVQTPARDSGAGRGFVWALAALAVTVVVMLAMPGEKRPVVQNDPPEKRAETAGAETKNSAGAEVAIAPGKAKVETVAKSLANPVDPLVADGAPIRQNMPAEPLQDAIDSNDPFAGNIAGIAPSPAAPPGLPGEPEAGFKPQAAQFAADSIQAGGAGALPLKESQNQASLQAANLAIAQNELRAAREELAGFYVVQIDAVRPELVDQALDRNQIAFLDGDQAKLKKSAGEALKYADRSPNNKDIPGREQHRKSQVAGSNVEVVYVEATADQFAGALQELRKNSEEIVGVSVHYQSLLPQTREKSRNANADADLLDDRAADQYSAEAPAAPQEEEFAEGDFADGARRALRQQSLGQADEKTDRSAAAYRDSYEVPDIDLDRLRFARSRSAGGEALEKMEQQASQDKQQAGWGPAAPGEALANGFNRGFGGGFAREEKSFAQRVSPPGFQQFEGAEGSLAGKGNASFAAEAENAAEPLIERKNGPAGLDPAAPTADAKSPGAPANLKRLDEEAAKKAEEKLREDAHFEESARKVRVLLVIRGVNLVPPAAEAIRSVESEPAAEIKTGQ